MIRHATILVGGLTPTYVLDPVRDRNLSYVRARVDDSGGFRAWIQPAFLIKP